VNTHGPFQIESWWDGHAERYNCVIHLGKLAVAQHDTFERGPVSAEFRAWREMAVRLAQLSSDDSSPVSPPMSLGVTP
jgi:hypothetical protein